MHFNIGYRILKMFQTKLIKLLTSLSARERIRFREFVDSPYFNKHPLLPILLEKVLIGIDQGHLSREELDTHLFPEDSFQYKRIVNLLSDLSQLLEKFLAHEQLAKTDFPLNYALIQSARERSLSFLFEQVSKRWDRKTQAKHYVTETDLIQEHLIEEERNIFFVVNKPRTVNKSLSGKLESLDRFFVATMLKGICQLINQQNILQSEAETLPYQDFIDHIQTHHQRYEKFPAIQIYFYILMTLIEQENEDHYKALKQLLVLHADDIPSEELQPMYQYAQNYCIKLANSGHPIYLEELFELYVERIDRGLIYFQGFIAPSDVKNIVTLGIRIGKLDWTAEFMNRIEPKIAPQHREHLVNYCFALIHHEKGELKKALRLLHTVHFPDVYFDLGTKTLLMKIYFELDDQEGLESIIHTFRAALRRNRLISTYQRKVHLNLIRFVYKLSVLRVKSITMGPAAFKRQVDRLRKQIETTQEISNINWLYGKLDELDK